MDEPVWEIINRSLKEGKVPREWNRANVVPIYKGGNKMEPLNAILRNLICTIMEGLTPTWLRSFDFIMRLAVMAMTD